MSIGDAAMAALKLLLEHAEQTRKDNEEFARAIDKWLAEVDTVTAAQVALNDEQLVKHKATEEWFGSFLDRCAHRIGPDTITLGEVIGAWDDARTHGDRVMATLVQQRTKPVQDVIAALAQQTAKCDKPPKGWSCSGQRVGI